MPRRAFATALGLALIAAAPLLAGPPEVIGQADALLARDDPRAAITLLEAALTSAEKSDRPALIEALRRSYEKAALAAESAGRAREAESYRDNLRILTRKAPTPKPQPNVEATVPVALPSVTKVGRDGRHTDDGITLAAADAAFAAKKYDEAGRTFAKLDERKQLPPSHRERWAYCRWAEVVKRINARPADAAEWESIRAEVEAVAELSPDNWFGEYLRNLVHDRAPGGASPRPKSDRAVIRAASPEEPKTKPKPEPRVGAPGAKLGNWQVWETPNFRILHADETLAAKVARAAETARDEQSRRWVGQGQPRTWSPRCDIYLYPTPALYRQMTGQPEDSPGFSTMGLNSGRVVARRVNLRANHPDLLDAVLPHEVTHVVLADAFGESPIPKWADEGIAVLSEPPAEQRRRAADLAEPLASGRLFAVGDLMRMDYPDGQHYPLFYAQSVSLTRFLVDRGTPEQFVRFLRGCQRGDLEDELRRSYKIDGLADLQTRWIAHAKAAPAAATARRD